MKVTQTSSLALGSIAQGQPFKGKAVIGGGGITTLAVAAHVRKKMAGGADQRIPANHPAERKAAIGGGGITTLAVAAHVRRKMSDAGQRSI